MKKIFEYIHGDRAIWMIVVILSLFSLLAVYSSTGSLAYRFREGNTEYYFFRHFIIVLLGLGLMYVAHRIKYTYYSRISQMAIILAIPLLVYTLFRGTSINEASRWVTLPLINLSFQSSDLAKLALVMYMARLLTRKQDQIKDFRQTFIPAMIPVLLISGLILPANFSTAALIFFTAVIMMFLGRVSLKHLGILLGSGALAVALFIAIALAGQDSGRITTWKNRITAYSGTQTSDNWQAEQSKIAIATGGIVGKFPGNSTQRNFLPHAYSDFIYAIIVEEYGLAGGILILLLYMILLYRGFRIAHRSQGTFGALLAAGLSFMLVFQALINMAVAVNIVPVTGQPLPLISMGGTSLWFSSIAIGIILSVSKSSEEEETQTETHGQSIATSQTI